MPTLPATALTVPAARGRGIVRLIEGLTAGDPVAWSILGGVVLIGIVWLVIKMRKAGA